MSSTVAATLFAVGVALLILFFAPGALHDSLIEPLKGRDLKERMQRALRLAGIFDKTPTIVFVSLLVVTVCVAIIIAVFIGNIILGIVAAVLVVPTAASFFLMSRQRRFLLRAADEISPFLNRIASATKAGMPVQTAYIQAVEESRHLRPILADSAAKMTAGMRFRDALVETIPLLPFRMWSVFVRQIEAHDEAGGDIGRGLDETVKAANEILLLHAEARANYATQAREQKLVMGVAIGGTLFFIFANGTSNFSLLWTTVAGWFAIIIAACVMAFGMWFTRKQLRDIEKKMSF